MIDATDGSPSLSSVLETGLEDDCRQESRAAVVVDSDPSDVFSIFPGWSSSQVANMLRDPKPASEHEAAPKKRTSNAGRRAGSTNFWKYLSADLERETNEREVEEKPLEPDDSGFSQLADSSHQDQDPSHSSRINSARARQVFLKKHTEKQKQQSGILIQEDATAELVGLDSGEVPSGSGRSIVLARDLGSRQNTMSALTLLQKQLLEVAERVRRRQPQPPHEDASSSLSRLRKSTRLGLNFLLASGSG